MSMPSVVAKEKNKLHSKEANCFAYSAKFFKGKFPLNETNFPQCFFSIVGIFAEDSNYRLIECYNCRNILQIQGKYGINTDELYLRYSYGCDQDLVVARIQFIHRRKGFMTRLYKVLKHIQRTYRTGKIIIEDVQTDEMRNWCHKNNFKETYSGSKMYEEKTKSDVLESEPGSISQFIQINKN